jgi:TPR repeat protein
MKNMFCLRMPILVFFLLMVRMTSVFALEGDILSSPSPSDLMELYKVEAEKLNPAQIFAELERQRENMSLRMAAGKSVLDMDEDTYKGAAYASVLERRRKAGEASAAFYFGVYNSWICESLQRSGNAQLSRAIQLCWSESMDSFKLASVGGLASASVNLGKMYRGGLGVAPSKLVASEWFVKAAEQYHKNNLRDDALASVESALEATPDHPAALRLRKAWLK